MDVLRKIYEAGVVGAGGAGFPTHKKLTDKARLLIVNAVECEPLLASDRFVMRTYPHEIIKALMALKEHLGIPRIVIGLKEKYTEEIASLEGAIVAQKAGVEISRLGGFYPGGDEQVLIYEVTGQTVPPGGIPLALGIVVINVTTALNVYFSLQGKPVVERFMTVTGEVAKPAVVRVPIGTSVDECIRAVDGPTVDRYVVIRGGPMMGKLFSQEEAKNLALGKQDGGLIVLSPDHPYVQARKKSLAHIVNQAKSACIQCSFCTELCPRYLIGHRLRPNRVMRSVASQASLVDLQDALLCSECGVCEAFACPMGLSPRQINIEVKGILREKGIGLAEAEIESSQSRFRAFRRVAQSRLLSRMGLAAYPTVIHNYRTYEPRTVAIPLKHGIGKPAMPIVKLGDFVNKGDVIGQVAFEDLGSLVHASVSGVVTAVGDQIVIQRKEQR